MGKKTQIRLLVLGVIVTSFLILGFGYATALTDDSVDDFLGPDGPTDPEKQVALPRDDITVIATDSNNWRGLATEDPRSRSQLVALNPDGSILYHSDVHTRHWDVDPVPGTDATVEYVYADHLEGSECEATSASEHAVDQELWQEYKQTHDEAGACTRNGIERVNLTTGETTDLWSRITPGKDDTRYHDADRINDTHYLVADIYLDRVFVVDISTDEIVWTWNASDDFSLNSGGSYPQDWTHINDVEVLDDGRYMVSVRNHDQVVFLDQDGIIDDWTLGEDDDHDTLYEPHNPDYIPESMGGPAVLIADSENGRVLEYQRENGEWELTWEWSHPQTHWPRDADRLPNGNTLISDSNGDRVIEVDPEGEIVWSVDIAFPYESERLGTGDESDGGPAATSPGQTGDPSESGFLDVEGLIKGKYVNIAIYLAPVWMGPLEVFALVLGLLAIVTQLLVEVSWFVTSKRSTE